MLVFQSSHLSLPVIDSRIDADDESDCEESLRCENISFNSAKDEGEIERPDTDVEDYGEELDSEREDIEGDEDVNVEDNEECDYEDNRKCDIKEKNDIEIIDTSMDDNVTKSENVTVETDTLDDIISVPDIKIASPALQRATNDSINNNEDKLEIFENTVDEMSSQLLEEIKKLDS